ncbi:DedA family protein [Streptomyces sp. PA03-1a]|nr:DedA family protein [Streptomyces sp. PA03-1a]MDX2813940.1 DedA family protein [Streptomyces sp. PA03-5A]
MHLDGLIEAAGWWSYVVVFAVTAGETSAFVGLLLPGETVILLAAAIAGRGDLDPLLLAAAVVTGGMAGDSLGFALGRHCERHPGTWLHRIRPDSRIGRAQHFLLRHGGAAVFTGRFVGFVRTFLPFVAGASGMPFRRFFAYSSAASLVWGVGNVLLGYFAGAAATELLHRAGLVAIPVLVAAGAAALVATRLLARHRRGSARAASRIVASGGRAPRTPEQDPADTYTSARES